MKYILIGFAAAIFLTACTYSITMAHTQGKAKDVIDETVAPSTPITPTLSIPEPIVTLGDYRAIA